ncbi:MAG: hypothetical protein JXR29_06705 [Methylothermaceae bacterium]|nr:hypothetical protein [Methylothermaceae bacterium]
MFEDFGGFFTLAVLVGLPILLYIVAIRHGRKLEREEPKRRKQELQEQAVEQLFLKSRLAWAKHILETYGDPDPDNELEAEEIEEIVTKARVAWSKLIMMMEEEKEQKRKNHR